MRDSNKLILYWAHQILFWEIYRPSHYELYCGLSKQETQAELVGALEIMTAAKLNLEGELVRYQKEVDLLHKQLKKQMTHHQVSHSSFSSTENIIFHLHRTFLRQKE
jgi:hypothetical protein